MGRTIALAYLHSEASAPGMPLEVEILGERRPASVVTAPLYDREGGRMHVYDGAGPCADLGVHSLPQGGEIVFRSPTTPPARRPRRRRGAPGGSLRWRRLAERRHVDRARRPSSAATETINIEIGGPFTGTSALTGTEMKNAAQMAFDAINWQVGNYKLNPVYVDDQADPRRAPPRSSRPSSARSSSPAS